MWSIKNSCNSFVSKRYVLSVLVLSLSSLSRLSSCHGAEWYTDDSVIVEPETLHDYEDDAGAALPLRDAPPAVAPRETRQLSHYPIVWPPQPQPYIKSHHMANRHQPAPGSGSGTPGHQSHQSQIGNAFGSCITVRGEVGFCATLRQCFPALYMSGPVWEVDGDRGDVKEAIRNPELADLLRSVSGNCKAPATESQFYFKADAQLLRQNLICCSTQDSKRPNVVSAPQPQPPMTHTTTMRPIASVQPLKYPNRPKIPIGFGGHRPPGAIVRPMPPVSKPVMPVKPMPMPMPQPPVPMPMPDMRETTTEGYLVESSCGEPKVVGGNETYHGKYPWMVALLNGQKQICGGSLIDNKFILTAAHCVAHMRPADIARVRILLGAHNTHQVNHGAVVKKIVKLMRHRGFSHKTLHNDIAILKLDSPVQFSSTIKPICLDRSQQQRYENRQAIVAGWGSVSEFGAQPQTLHDVALDIWSNAQCKAKYGHLAPGGIMDHMMCAGSPDRDACRGDSGGPLMSYDGRKYTQIGLVSWGIGCGRFPGVYSRVADFRDWIDKQREL